MNFNFLRNFLPLEVVSREMKINFPLKNVLFHAKTEFPFEGISLRKEISSQSDGGIKTTYKRIRSCCQVNLLDEEKISFTEIFRGKIASFLSAFKNI